MQKEFLREVITLATGKQSETIADLLDTKKYINEFLIAKKLDLTINQARNILYKLSDQGLVSYIRKKDKKKGWYTYFWKIESLKTLNFLKNELIKKIESIEHQIKSRETKVFYICERCNIEFTEESALLHDFACIECGDILTMMDSSKILRELGKELSRYQKKIKEVNSEIEKEEILEQKQKIKENAKSQKKTVKKTTKKKTSKKIIKNKKVKKKNLEKIKTMGKKRSVKKEQIKKTSKKKSLSESKRKSASKSKK